MSFRIDFIDKQFSQYMLEDKIYRMSGLTLKQACMIMAVTPGDLRQFLKETHGSASFRAIVNYYRIEEAIEIWNKNQDYPVSLVAKRVGYHSCFTFFYWFMRIKW